MTRPLSSLGVIAGESLALPCGAGVRGLGLAPAQAAIDDPVAGKPV
jgi:hypothetical protein